MALTISKITIAATALVSLSAAAQVQQPDSLLEYVLVSATQVPQNAHSLALNWATLDTEALAITGHVHINELMQRVPGAWISRGNGQESLPALRSPVLTGAGSCGAFFMAADGISLRAPGFCNINQLFDANSEQAQAVEVIKGPATALYGSNAMHGVINVLSAAPSQKVDHELSIATGPHDYFRSKYHYRGTHGLHGVSINLNGATDGGYKDDSGYDQQKASLRHDYTGSQWQFSSVLDLTNLNQETAGFVRGFKAYEESGAKKDNPNPEAYRDVRSLRAYTRATHTLDDRNTLILTPYLRDNEMAFLMHFVPWQPVEKNGHRSLGLQAALHTQAEQWSIVNGIDLDYTDGWLKETQANAFSPNQPTGVHYDYQVDAVTAAMFSQATYTLSSDLEISGGLRYEFSQYDYNNRTGDGTACAPQASACRFYRPADREDNFSNVSLNAGASYALTDKTWSYLRIARGFRAPQATELYRLQSGQERAELESEELSNIEIGLRGTLANNLSFDISAYYMEKDEVIFLDSNRQNVSGASTRHQGLELSLDYRFSQNGYFGLDASRALHRYTSDIALLGSSTNIDGNDIDTAPRNFGSARLGWNFSTTAVHAGSAELEWIYLGSHYLEPDNAHKYDGHSLLNFRVSTQLGKRWNANARITNLLNKDYAERADFGFGAYRYFVGEPRGVYVELSYQFGAI